MIPDGVEPSSPACRAGVVPLDQQPAFKGKSQDASLDEGFAVSKSIVDRNESWI